MRLGNKPRIERKEIRSIRLFRLVGAAINCNDRNYNNEHDHSKKDASGDG